MNFFKTISTRHAQIPSSEVVLEVTKLAMEMNIIT